MAILVPPQPSCPHVFALFRVNQRLEWGSVLRNRKSIRSAVINEIRGETERVTLDQRTRSTEGHTITTVFNWSVQSVLTLIDWSFDHLLHAWFCALMSYICESPANQWGPCVWRSHPSLITFFSIFSKLYDIFTYFTWISTRRRIS